MVLQIKRSKVISRITKAMSDLEKGGIQMLPVKET